MALGLPREERRGGLVGWSASRGDKAGDSDRDLGPVLTVDHGWAVGELGEAGPTRQERIRSRTRARVVWVGVERDFKFRLENLRAGF